MSITNSASKRRIIEISQGKHVIVDTEDYEYLSQWKWYFNKRGAAVRKIYHPGNKQTVVYMHREIMRAKKGEEVDHINHNQLDNRKVNLRLCSRAQNNFNIRRNKKNTSGFKGVSYIKQDKAWRAYISQDNKQIHLGRYKTAREAAEAYNTAALSMRGEFAWTNRI